MTRDSEKKIEVTEQDDNLHEDIKMPNTLVNNVLKTKEENLNIFKIYLDNKAKKLQIKENELYERELAIQEKEKEINQKEKKQEIELKKEQVEKKQQFEIQLAEKEKEILQRISRLISEKRENFEKILINEEFNRRDKLDKELSEKAQFIEKELANKQKNIDQEISEKRRIFDEEIRTEKLELREREEELDKKENELEQREKKVEIEMKKNSREMRRLKIKEEELFNIESDIEEEINTRNKERIEKYKNDLDIKDCELKKLRDELAQLKSYNESCESFKHIYGDEPILLEKEIRQLKSDKYELLERLSKSPSTDLNREYDILKKENEDLKLKIDSTIEQNKILNREQEQVDIIKIEKERAISKNNELNAYVNELKQRCEQYEEKIMRLNLTETKLVDREQRIAQITNDYKINMFGEGLPNEFTEIDWLNKIFDRCCEYGISFSRRILYSFHTALKISDWSSITVLAGVSGTGKSELPKLYAAFGGLNFISVPVQPSWDSQESMLGFFNSIDNRFEPEELLSFLVECTENEKYNKYMSIILLDEMNLAHVEHYFADFLSKLETRRGTSKNNVPTIEVKLGSGVEPYKLKLERSLLWTGTMNQDETTKSLSDKVLDRGIVINFPRPKKLSSRKTMSILDQSVKKSGRPMLTRKTWGKWIVRNIDLIGDQQKEMEKYKNIVEEINIALENVGRALGHRVWQSIEYYILNYPTVVAERNKLTKEVISDDGQNVKNISTGELSTSLAEAMKTAFEDQIVQKIMPKLRGIETRGKGKENLQKIEDLLEEKGFEGLKDDFEIACEQGYGQFIWSSAKYIEKEEQLNDLRGYKTNTQNS